MTLSWGKRWASPIFWPPNSGWTKQLSGTGNAASIGRQLERPSERCVIYSDCSGSNDERRRTHHSPLVIVYGGAFFTVASISPAQRATMLSVTPIRAISSAKAYAHLLKTRSRAALGQPSVGSIDCTIVRSISDSSCLRAIAKYATIAAQTAFCGDPNRVVRHCV